MVYCLSQPSGIIIILSRTLNTHRNVYVHVLQLKNMVSALFSSGGGMRKTKLFCNKGEIIGWDTIARLWKREEERAEWGLMSEVPKLKEQYIKRDSWTHLNVAPAKIMQVRTHTPSLSLSLSLSLLPRSYLPIYLTNNYL